MEKSKLERFILKYNLGGACESVVIKSQNDKLSVRAMDSDKNVIGEISAPNAKFPAGEFGIFDTKKLRSMLGVLGENLTITPNVVNGITTGLHITDGSTKITYALADTSVVKPVPNVSALPNWDITITIDEKFVNTFSKAKSALNEVNSFSVSSTGDDNTATIVLGQSTSNTNRIAIPVKTDSAVKMKSTSFSANYFREILNANKDISAGTFYVSSKGLAIAEFKSPEFTATYYLVQVSDDT